MKQDAVNAIGLAVIAIVIVIAVLAFPCRGEVVTRVIDGDTLVLEDGRTVRLRGVDAPEMNQLGGGDAKLIVERLVLGKEVDALNPKSAAWGRTEAQIYRRGDLGATLLSRGYAMVDERYVSGQLLADYRRHQAAAKQAKRGIWAPQVAPWNWRKHGINSPTARQTVAQPRPVAVRRYVIPPQFQYQSFGAACVGSS